MPAGRDRDDDPQAKLELVQAFFSDTGSSYDRVVNLATFGIDRWWKRRIVDTLPPNPQRVLDLACGTGILTLAIAHRFPRCQVVGVELREEYLIFARAKIEKLGLTNVELVRVRAEDYQSSQPFDCIVSSYLAKYAEIDRLIRHSRQMLKDDGLVLMHDFTFPPGRVLVGIWRAYFKLLQWVGTPFLPAWREIFFGLPQLIEHTRWTTELISVLDAHHFGEIRTVNLTAYGSAIVTARKIAG